MNMKKDRIPGILSFSKFCKLFFQNSSTALDNFEGIVEMENLILLQY